MYLCYSLGQSTSLIACLSIPAEKWTTSQWQDKNVKTGKCNQNLICTLPVQTRIDISPTHLCESQDSKVWCKFLKCEWRFGWVYPHCDIQTCLDMFFHQHSKHFLFFFFYLRLQLICMLVCAAGTKTASWKQWNSITTCFPVAWSTCPGVRPMDQVSWKSEEPGAMLM